MTTKRWIRNAIEKPGAFSAAAKRSDKSTAAFAKEHDGDAGIMGKRARLAEVLMRLRKTK